jgi:DnaJ-class molecular chaperone
MVKKHHPDVVGSESPNTAIFRQVMEAYGVLSVPQSRVSYDISKSKNPDAYNDVSESDFNKTHRPDLRDGAGNTPVDAAAPGSYAETRLRELKEERKKYNANDLGYYRGGVPMKNRGPLRGSATGMVNEFHHPTHHNFLNNYHPDSKEVSSEDSVKFKNFMQADKIPLTMTRPQHLTYYDTDLDFSKDRRFWGGLVMFMLFGTAAVKKF